MKFGKNQIIRGLGAFAVLLLPTSCNLGTAVKTLGTNSASDGLKTANNADSFAIQLAYRDPSTDSTTPLRTVSVQGAQDGTSSLSSECGSTGLNCKCWIYRTSTDSSPVATAIQALSTLNNSIACQIPTSITDAQIKANSSGFFVMVQSTANTSLNSGLLPISTTLTLQQVIGSSLATNIVRGIYRYTCTRTFFEGEGVSVSASQVTCTAGQHLGVITATNNFYLYQSQTESNMSSRGTDTAFSSAICSNSSFLQIKCSGSVPLLRYGLYGKQTGVFTVGISMTPSPSGTSSASVNYGFAALPDSSGNCPVGLVKIRPYLATPASLIKGSVDASGSTLAYPTSFLNSSGSLNDTVVEQSQSSQFMVYRQPNAVPCDSTGSCATASVGGTETAESVTYTANTPIVCAIPPSLLSGLF